VPAQSSGAIISSFLNPFAFWRMRISNYSKTIRGIRRCDLRKWDDSDPLALARIIAR
jgi:hypothetical protein